MTSLAAADMSDLIGLIYDCALDPDLWPATLARLKDRLGFIHATLSLQEMPSGRVLLNVTSGIPSPWSERIADYGQDIIALWGGPRLVAQAPLEEPVLLSRMNPEVRDGTSRNRYYLEWRKPQGLIDTVALGLTRDTGSLAAASLVRHRDQGPVDERDLELIRLFAPHLKRAVTIGRLLEAQTIAAASFEAVLDGVGTPILLVDASMRLVHANSAGHAALEHGDPLHLRDGAVGSANLAVARALAAALAQTVSDESGINRMGLGIPALSEDGSAHALHVLPLLKGGTRARLRPGATAALFLSSSNAQRTEVGQIVAALFDLSRAEARVFEQIASGETVADAAATLGIGASTVRTHLLRIFEKVGVRRQADLVKLAAALALPNG